jgi:hypothetical protein
MEGGRSHLAAPIVESSNLDLLAGGLLYQMAQYWEGRFFANQN